MKTLIPIFYLLLILTACRQKLELYDNKSAPTTIIKWRKVHPVTRFFMTSYRIKIKEDKQRWWPFYYRANIDNARRLNDTLKFPVFQNEVIRNRIYQRGSANSYYFNNNSYAYKIFIVNPYSSSLLILEESYRGKKKYYNLGRYSNLQSATLVTIAGLFKTYKFELPVMQEVLNFLNQASSVSKDFNNVGLVFKANDANDKASKTREVYLADNSIETIELNENVKLGKFHVNFDEKNFKIDKQNVVRLDGTSGQLTNMNFRPKSKPGFADSTKLECEFCKNKDNPKITEFILQGKFKATSKSGKNDSTANVNFKFQVNKATGNEYEVVCTRRKMNKDSAFIKSTFLPGDDLTAVLEQIKQLGINEFWEEDTNNTFSKTVTNKILSELKINFIKISTKTITDSILSAYEFDFGKAGVVGLKRKFAPLYSLDGDFLTNTYIEIQDVHILTDNNRISDATITGHLFENGIDMGLRVITNSAYSLSFDGLNKDYFSILIYGSGDIQYVLRYSDLLFYKPVKGAFSYFVKNQETTLCPEKKKNCFELDRRALYDYLSLRVFLDPFAFLSKTPSGLTLFEGNATIPSNVRNYKQWTPFDQVTAKFDYILASATATSAINDRLIKGIIDEKDTINLNSKTINLVDNLDLFRKFNYKFEYYQSLLQRENKRTSQWTHLELGFVVIGGRTMLYKTIKLNQVPKINDSTIVNLTKFIPALRLKGELRPDAIFGLNWSAGLLYTGSLSKGNNDYNNSGNPTFAYRGRYYRNLVGAYELNFYAMLSKKATGGLFFKHNGYLTWYSDSKWGFFPQFLVGYATNINAFIKTVSKSNN